MVESNSDGSSIGLELRRNPAFHALTQEIADFLYREVDLIDERRFEAWLDLLAEDLVYFMPMRRNVRHGYHDEQENTVLIAKTVQVMYDYAGAKPVPIPADVRALLTEGRKVEGGR